MDPSPLRRSSRLRQSTNIDDLVDEDDMYEDDGNGDPEEEEESGNSEYFDIEDADAAMELLENAIYEAHGPYGDHLREGDEDDDDDEEEYEEEEDPDYEETQDSESSVESDGEHAALFAIIGNAFQIRLPRSVRPGRRRRRPRPGQENLEPVPSEEGRELMISGTFGYNDFSQPKKRKRKDSTGDCTKSPMSSPPHSPVSTYSRGRPPLETYKRRPPKQDLPRRLLAREMGNYADGNRISITNQLMAQSMIPNRIDKIIHFESRCYSGQFSQDGDFFYCCSQNMNVRMYDTTNPYDWKYYKTEEYPGGRWTITDATLTPDNKWIAYSSIDSSVYMAGTQREEEVVELLDFSNGPRRYSMTPGTGIWSIRFSGDSKELVCGANDNNIYLFDLNRGHSILKLRGHTNDVNAVCFGDNNSPHILFSGSDDGTIKVWDRRSMASQREAGIFVGHLEGLTYIDAKGDGRYVLSNSKDQTMKLWDIRKMMDRNTFDNLEDPYFGRSDFDYRFDTYDHTPIRRHPDDCSVVTFRGHSVLRTLIRCHFSPGTSTGDRYVYSGSEDGRVHIYNLDGTVAGVIDVQRDTKNSRPKRRHYNNLNAAMFIRGGSDVWGSCVRDVSWHPNAPLIAATAWSGYGTDMGTVSVHSWDGASKGKGYSTDTKDVMRKLEGVDKGTADRGDDDDDEEDGYVREEIIKENWDDGYSEHDYEHKTCARSVKVVEKMEEATGLVHYDEVLRLSNPQRASYL